MIDKLFAIDDRLVAAGFPAMPPWWRETFARFIASGKRTLVLRVGRRGGKSSMLMRLALVLALFGEWRVGPGEIGTIPIVSVSRTEAAERIRLAKAILDALGLKHAPAGEYAIEIVGHPLQIKVHTASIAGVSGFTTVGAALIDEMAKLRDADTNQNPATEVLASLKPTMATQPGARLFLSSSPMSVLDAHYDAFERGDTADQMVAYAPTWIANPSVSEADTHALEPDPRIWAREYAAVPQSAVCAAFDPAMIERCMRVREFGPATPPALIVDPSSGRGDGYASALAHWTQWSQRRACKMGDIYSPDGKTLLAEAVVVLRDRQGVPIPDDRPRVPPCLVISKLDVLTGAFADRLSSATVVKMLALKAKDAGARTWIQDQREAYALEADVKKNGLRFVSIAWTNEGKADAVTRIRKLMIQDALSIPNDEALRRELSAFNEKVLASGVIRYEGRRDDRVAVLLTAAMADIENHLHDSPIRKPASRVEYGGGW